MDDDGEATAVRVEKGSSGLVTEAPTTTTEMAAGGEAGKGYKDCCGRRRRDGTASGMAAASRCGGHCCS